MQINGAVALVTGANRGIGRQFASQLLDRGARVYATARRPELVDLPGATVLALDITDPASVAAAAEAAPDVNLLINNAGVTTATDLVGGDLAEVRRELDTHFWGTLSVIRAFAAQLGDGAILNVLSALSWFAHPGSGAYSVAKAAEWSLTNSVRLELAAQRTLVTGLHMGAVDTDMMAGYDIPKLDPADVARQALDAIEADRIEVLADGTAVAVKASLAADPADFYFPARR
ncbi:SDR family oxidoreductase [Micromonospora rifamycinica]|uniref:Short-chain dehydrogenase n=1 Tax=Micromonospora rifamycinica TaxID=291594 RepID=A0A109ILP2_9ACTN|nr:SDR family oxidoreductase [Micromonospora rifamycinica]KWV32758.1 short-chain dehydrogenase [Micromonospora rifamycinica]SCG41514.1 Short-chain dehydrogenase [Micromonospora rifamycinica]